MTTAIYFDESGYTGGALLDPVQPFFCVASSIISEQEAQSILREAFPQFSGQEFKFQQIWRRDRTRSQLVRFAQELGKRQGKIFLWVIDKKFCVLTKLIDFLVEPVLHDMGLDFYKNGYASKFSNYVHFGFTVVENKELYDVTVRAYYDFARDPTEARLAEFQWRMNLMASSVPEEVRFFYEMAAKGAVEFHEHSDITTFKETMEVQLTSVLASVGHWRHLLAGPLELFHDESNNFFNQADLWGAITAHTVPSQLHPQAFAPPIQFPLQVLMTRAVDSKSSFAIQLCDVIAGLAVKVAKKPGSDAEKRLCEEIMLAGLGDLTFNGIRPGLVFPEGPPEPLDGPDAVDRFMNIIKPTLWPKG